MISIALQSKSNIEEIVMKNIHIEASLMFLDNHRLQDLRDKHAMKTQIAVRGLIIYDDKLLIVSNDGNMWYTPGGRLENDESLKDCLKREIYEETGLRIIPGDIEYVSEFLDEVDNVKKIEIYFTATIEYGQLDNDWKDHSGPVKFKEFATLEQVKRKNVFPDFIQNMPWVLKKSENKKVYKGISVKLNLNSIQKRSEKETKTHPFRRSI